MRRLYRLRMAAMLLALQPILHGCSTPTRVDASPEAAPAAPTQPAPPEVVLEPELLYQLLLAEISGQQGALRLSAATYLETAQRTRDYRLARRAAHIALYARENSIALKASRLWVELEPQSSEAHRSMAALLISAGHSEQAMPHLQQLLQPQAQGGGLDYPLVASLLANDPQRESALAIMAKLVSQAPNDPQALYAHAQLAHQLDAPETAHQVLQQLLQQQPKHTQGLTLLARIQHTSGDIEAALRTMKRALQSSPDNYQLRLTYARMLIDARHLKEARRQFSLLSKEDPNDADVRYALGLLALESGDLESAEQHFSELLQQHQREEESRFALGQIYESRRQYDKAIDWYGSIAQGERFIDAQLQAARLIAQQRGMDQARNYLHDLESQNDNERAQLLLAEGELLSSAGEHQEAMRVFGKGLDITPKNIDLLYARALTAEKMGRIDLLERDLKAILKQEPNNAQALNALGYTLADRTQRFKEAYGYIMRAYHQRPDDFTILDSMGWVLYRMGRHEEALQFLRQAAAQRHDPEVAAHLGEVLWVTGKQQEARRIWNEALKSAPQHKVLQQTIQRFTP